ncbi:alkaline phosphatase D family protein [Opitutales bacterium]|nr:alkaline phosphatase D family protein [Opitutales bacterium]
MPPIPKLLSLALLPLLASAANWSDGSNIHTQPDSELTEISSWQSWDALPERRWLGLGFWGNRLQDWSIREGKLIYTSAQLRMPKTLHSLQWRSTGAHAGFQLKTRLALPADKGEGFAGFLIGAGQDYLNWQAASLISGNPGTGGGLMATVDFGGNHALRIRDNNDNSAGLAIAPVFPELKILQPAKRPKESAEFVLSLEVIPTDAQHCTLRLSSWNHDESRLLSAVELTDVSSDLLQGNIALVANGGKRGAEVSFKDWQIGGERLANYPDRSFGPIAGTLYAHSAGKLKVGVQLIPQSIHGQAVPAGLMVGIQKQDTSGNWQALTSPTTVSSDDYHTVFTIDSWDSSQTAQLRACFKDLDGTVHTYPFTVIPEPAAGEQIDIGTFSCFGSMSQYAQRPFDAPKPDEVLIGRWTQANVYHPYTETVSKAQQQDADIFFFTGDQFYENRPTAADGGPNPLEDYLYKFLLWHWAFQDITANHPCILQTDDHDVFHGDLFGEDKIGNTQTDQHGGYHRSREFVNMVHKTMTSQNPDTLEPKPSPRSGLTNYYTSFNYGDVSFFVLEDRKFKKGAKSEDADYPETYLGERQLQHLRAWCETPMPGKRKVLVAQTIYAAMSLDAAGKMPYDWDVNALYIDERNEIVQMLAEAKAVILSGDQHLCTFSRLGYASHNDKSKPIQDSEYSNGPYQFCAPPGGNVFWRWFWPSAGLRELDEPKSDISYVGGFRDFFGNPFTMLAVANPEKIELQTNRTRIRLSVTQEEVAQGAAQLYRTNKGDGFGMMRFNKQDEAMTVEAWPVYGKGQYPGFPQVISYESIEATEKP